MTKLTYVVVSINEFLEPSQKFVTDDVDCALRMKERLLKDNPSDNEYVVHVERESEPSQRGED